MIESFKVGDRCLVKFHAEFFRMELHLKEPREDPFVILILQVYTPFTFWAVSSVGYEQETRIDEIELISRPQKRRT